MIFTSSIRSPGRNAKLKGGEYIPGKRYPITVENLKSRWERDRAKAAKVVSSVATLRWHDLRHTFATRMLRKTSNLSWVQTALGHTSPAMTRPYAHVINDDVRLAKNEARDGAFGTKLLANLLTRLNLNVVG